MLLFTVPQALIEKEKIDNNNKLYVLIEHEAASGNITPRTDDKIANVSNYYNDCNQDGCTPYVEAIVDNVLQTINLYELMEK